GEEVKGAGRIRRRVADLHPDRVVLQERATLRRQGIERPVRVRLAEPRFQPSVAPAHCRAGAQMASDAGRLVEDGPETVCHILFLHERRPALLEERKLFCAEPRTCSAKWAAAELR